MPAVSIGDASSGVVTLGEGPVKTIVPVTSTALAHLLADCRQAGSSGCDVVEWRVDHFQASGHFGASGHPRAPDGPSPGRVAAIAARSLGKPLLATLRTSAQGGRARVGDAEYLALLADLADSGHVHLLDVEFSRPCAGEAIAHAHDRGLPVLASHHDFEATPPRAAILDALASMAAAGADVVKTAYMPASPDDVLALLGACAQASRDLPVPVVAISMGRLGLVSRVAAGSFGSAATFASVAGASAPGQPPLAELSPILDALERWS